jgi:glycosyltransferase involved in cell wall biosynthesis
LTSKLVIFTEIIAPYRIPVFNALAKRKELDLHVIFLAENDPGLRQWRVYRDEIEFSYEVLPSWRRRVCGYHLLINRGVAAALHRIQPNIILCGGYNYVASWQAAYWARARQIPLLLWTESTASDTRNRHRTIEFLKTRFLRQCDAFVVPGSASSNYLRELGISGDRIFTAPNAVDNERFLRLAEFAREQEKKLRSQLSLPARYFLYSGRIVREKGVFDVLEAYAAMPPKVRANISLLFAGDGPGRAELMQRASRIKPGTIQFPGFLQRDDLAQFYTLGDALVFPTHSDPWGLVVNEAMLCGLPVIVSAVAGCAPDLVQDKWNGFVVPPRDVGPLADAMTCIASDSALRSEMGNRSRERIERYSPAAWSEGMVNMVNAVSAIAHRNR